MVRKRTISKIPNRPTEDTKSKILSEMFYFIL